MGRSGKSVGSSFTGGRGGVSNFESLLSFDWKDFVTFFHPELHPDFACLETFVNSST